MIVVGAEALVDLVIDPDGGVTPSWSRALQRGAGDRSARQHRCVPGCGGARLREFVNTVVSELTDPIDPDFARTFVADTSTDVLPVELVEALVEGLVKVPVRLWKEMFPSLLVSRCIAAGIGVVTQPSSGSRRQAAISKASRTKSVRMCPAICR